MDWDVFVDDDMVVPGGGGLSVFADPSHMPSFRLPPEFGGDGRHPMWTIDTEELEGFADLELVPGDALGQATG